ncbi:hypothetical protein BGP77_16410 [Saccharospirillum sp. MSK14-1]|uniref:hypothetical protein n=1 Tax=Saccharospirillum sp. MSK14-1 TaxID=1897632 RepID=UPI000D3CBFD0|nr:hypothetical protein [Saccharospirillum sp. MSK14-1]PTY38037.1 hypothetical protein BGP77_16410 [Saccharospirillum sp. MSK14-1]
MRSLLIALSALAISPGLLAEEGPFDASASARAATVAQACDDAFKQAEAKALADFEAAFLSENRPQARRIELRERTDERLPADALNAQPGCRVEGRWAAIAVASDDAEPEPLNGRIETIDGEYSSECSAADEAAACKRRIETQAASDLRTLLQADDPQRLNGYRLAFDGFEGDQAFTYKGERVSVTMNGLFYFRLDQSEFGPITPAPGTQGDLRIERKEKDNGYDDLDVTVFYVWDGNNAADPNDLALSTNRWGLGLWVNNRLGVSAFWGEERPGIANDNHYVRNDDSRYGVFGIGLGYRLFDSRDMTVENSLYYVDTEPFDVTLDNGRVYETQDYIQTNINIKTNSSFGPNVGWMFTWKLRPDLSDYNALSGGWYVEWQF